MRAPQLWEMSVGRGSSNGAVIKLNAPLVRTIKAIETDAVLCEGSCCSRIAEYMIIGSGRRPDVSAYCYTHALQMADVWGLHPPPAKETMMLKRAAGSIS